MEPLPVTPFATVRDLLAARQEDYGDRVFLRFEDEARTFRELMTAANRLGNALVREGVRPGDHVAIWMKNRISYVELLFAIAKIGAVAVTINSELKGDGAEYVLRQSDARLVILGEETARTYFGMRSRLPAAKAFCLVDGEYLSLGSLRGLPAGVEPFQRLYDAPAGDPPDPGIGKNSPYCIIFTSGTTGLPKGVVLPHHAYVNTAWWYSRHVVDAGEGDVFFSTLPFYHCNAQIFTLMSAIAAKSSMAMVKRFSASRFFDQTRRYGATIFNFIGMMIVALSKQPPRPDDRDNPVTRAFGIPVPVHLAEEFEKRFGLKLLEGYGATETACGFAFTTVHDRKLGAAGRPLPYAEVRIVDDNDEPLPPNQIGQIVMRTHLPWVWMTGYYKNDEATVQAWRNGWLHLNDLGMMDEDGWIYFRGRKGDWIRRRGENISSAEIENVLDQHPAVMKSAAIGVPSELTEHEVKAFVQLKPGETVDPAELFSWMEDRLASYMLPKYIEFIDQLPTTATGKIEKYRLSKSVDNCWVRE